MNQLYALPRPSSIKLHTAWAWYLLLGLLAFSFAASAQTFINTTTLCDKATLIVGDVLAAGGGETMTFPFNTSANSPNPVAPTSANKAIKIRSWAIPEPCDASKGNARPWGIDYYRGKPLRSIYV